MDRITFWAMMGTSYKTKSKSDESCKEKNNKPKGIIVVRKFSVLLSVDRRRIK
jgi:hypothetical protein